MDELSHYTEDGSSRMVDISVKKISTRSARAAGIVKMKEQTLDLVESKMLPKGDLFEVARIAGIFAAKNTSSLIPMCHPLLLTYVNINIEINRKKSGICIDSDVRLQGKTGAEMEALTAVSIAALTIYDMCKSVDKTMVVEDIKLLEKKGGKSDLSV